MKGPSEVGIEIRDLAAGYVRDVPVVRHVTVDVESESITSVIGPNGSGKSTLLKAIMGLADVFDGEVIVDSENIGSVAVHRRIMRHGLAFVPQLSNVFGPMTVMENLEIGGAALSRRDRRGRIDELLDTYPDLANRRRQRAESMSGGQRQALAFARALMTRPSTLLLDEPSAGLSPRLVDELFETVQRTRDAHNVTILLVEQNAVQALRISDEAVVLVAGEVAIAGPAAAVLQDKSVAELYLGASA